MSVPLSWLSKERQKALVLIACHPNALAVPHGLDFRLCGFRGGGGLIHAMPDLPFSRPGMAFIMVLGLTRAPPSNSDMRRAWCAAMASFLGGQIGE